MTIAGVADRLRLYLQIDGLEPGLWEDDGSEFAYSNAYTYEMRFAGDGGGDHFGRACAIYGDVAAVGHYTTVEIFERAGKTWTSEASLTPPNGSPLWTQYDCFSVWGGTVVVGNEDYDDAGDENQGACHVYVKTGDTWGLQQTVQASDKEQEGRFGCSAAIYKDTLIVGARGMDSGGTSRGQAYVFTRSGSTWTEDQILSASDKGDNDQFGRTVAIYGDYIAIGAPNWDEGGGSNEGCVYIFKNVGGTWTEQCKIQPTTADNAWIGQTSLRMWDGAVAIPQASGDNCVYIYTGSDATWTLQQKISAGETINGYLDFKRDLLAIGIPDCSTAPHTDGAVDVYQRFGGVWKKITRIGPDTPVASGTYGRCVAIDGESLVAGDGEGTTVGAAMFKVGDHPWIHWQGVERKSCLTVANEYSMDLDLGEMKTGISAMTFELNDIEDTDGNSYFGKLFAPGRWDTGRHLRVSAGSGPNEVIDANATAIPVVDTSSWIDAPGYAHIGQEQIYFTGTNADHLTGCTRGLYPAVGSDNFGTTYARPEDGEAGYHMAVGQYPYSWIGRRVSLYLVEYDRTTKTWQGADDASLLWMGRISNQIVQDGRTRKWKVACNSIISDLEQKIGNDFPATHLKGINLQGDKGRKFRIIEHRADNGNHIDTGEITIPKGHYGYWDLLSEVMSGLNTASWSTGNHFYGVHYELVWHWTGTEAGTFRLEKISGSGAITYNVNFTLDAKQPDGYSHALAALGFDGRMKWDVEITYAGSQPIGQYWDAQNGGMFEHYHPIRPICNGSKIYVEDAAQLWDDQGDDDGDTQANVMIKDAVLDVAADKKGAIYYRYGTPKDEVNHNLTIDWEHFYQEHNLDGYAGAKIGDPAPGVQQVYIPRYDLSDGTRQYPFGMLLLPLLSTGTPGYNGTFDKLPLTLACNIHEDLVDTDSFQEADKAIWSSPLAQRRTYVIDKPISWVELAQRECKMFGYAVVWRNGELTLANIAQPNAAMWTVQLDESTRADSAEFPTATSDLATVVNQYRCRVEYDYTTARWGPEIIVTDVDSVVGLQVTKEVFIEHPGVYYDYLSGSTLKEMLTPFLQSRFLRYPQIVVKVSLAHDQINKVFVGDVVRFASDKVSDPLGSGTYSTTILATVLNVSWNYKETAPRGSATLLLHGWNNGQGDPWAPSALVNRAHDNGGTWAGGYNQAAYQLMLMSTQYGNSGDPDDGSAFASGDKVQIIERYPYDPDSADSWTSTLAKAYEADGAGVMTLSSPLNMLTWSNTKEYIVIPDDYGTIVTAQKSEGTWMANVLSHLLDGGALAQRYG